MNRLHLALSRLSDRVTDATGSPFASLLAVLIVILWIASGPIANYSTTWQLVINTGTTIVTFVMVFFIQHSTNRSSRALHVKLDEVLVKLNATRGDLAGLEDEPEETIRARQDEIRLEAETTQGQTDETRL